MNRLGTLRNIVIVLAIAAAVEFLPGGGRGASTFQAILWTVFAFGIGYVGVRMYREYRISIYSLGSEHRALLYGSLALGAVLLAARASMWDSAGGELLWFILIGLAVYGLVAVYRFWRSY